MNPGIMAAIAVCLVDSVVTIWVGLRLNNTAERKIQEGLEELMKHAPELLAEAFNPKAGE